MKTVYLDNNATTRVAPEVIEAMIPFLSEYWGNPSSVYSFGRQVARHVEAAREKVAALLASGSPNCYTIEKAGIKKLIYQSPWFEDGTYRGFVEISIPMPDLMPHFVRE